MVLSENDVYPQQEYAVVDGKQRRNIEWNGLNVNQWAQ